MDISSCLRLSSSTNLTTVVTPSSTSSSPKPSNLTFKSHSISKSKSISLDQTLHLLLHQSKPPNLDSYTTFLHTCISAKSLSHGKTLYLHLLNSTHTRNLLKDPTLKSKFVTLFSACGRLDDATTAFRHGLDDMGFVPESVFVAMAIGFSKNGRNKEALLVYCEMLSRGCKPGNFSFSVALKACAGLAAFGIGRGVHAQIVKANVEPDQVVYNALLRFYSECGGFHDVLKMFDEMPDRNVATWNALVSGFFKKDLMFEAFETFRKMQRAEVGFTWVSLTTVLAVCARLTALYIGKEVHGRVLKSSECPDTLVINSLLDMYAKCGEMVYCGTVFNSMVSKDLTSWNTVINGYAINGLMVEAVALFDEMIEAGFKPDKVTFISLLSGCSHNGMVNEGQVLFDRMSLEFGIQPSVEHYACLVDMLGRAGKTEEALELVKKMPMEPSASIWGSLFNSCRMFGHVSLAEGISNILFKLEPENPGNYVILSNIYANAGMWDDVKVVRELMENKKIKKEAGCSWVHVKDRVHSFLAGGGFEFRNSDEFRRIWAEMNQEMEKRGYRPDTGVVLHDISEELKVEWVCGHSERLATIFALIQTGSGLPIRITKNLRVCADCHTWMKFASEVSQRKIILRDTNRFHHFEKGNCSCNDYW